MLVTKQERNRILEANERERQLRNRRGGQSTNPKRKAKLSLLTLKRWRQPREPCSASVDEADSFIAEDDVFEPKVCYFLMRFSNRMHS